MPTGRSSRKASRIKILRRDKTIDGVMVDEPFTFSRPRNNKDGKVEDIDEDAVGEGCYISVTIGARKFFGILVEHSAMLEATNIYFESEVSSLEINRKMRNLKDQQQLDLDYDNVNETSFKKARTGDECKGSAIMDSSVEIVGDYDLSKRRSDKKQVQKFQYVTSRSVGESDGPGYRDLVATYADPSAASEDDAEKEFRIEEACENDGNFVGDFYYQYEIKDKTLQVNGMPREKYDNSDEKFDVWSSLSFHTFLRYTPFPPWHPLSNVSGKQNKVLQMLQREHR